MDEFESIIEKYRRELIDFSKNDPYRATAAQTESNETYEEKSAVTVSSVKESVSCENETADADCIPEPEIQIEAGSDEQKAFSDSQELNGYTQPVESSAEDYFAPEFNSYEDFIKNNPETGSLRFQVFAADRAFPIQSARVTVVLELKNESRELFDGLTDINGIIDAVSLPAPGKSASLEPSQTGVLPYSSYTAYIEHPEFVREKIINIPVFSGIKSIQDVEMIPLVAVGGEPSQIEENEGESFLRLKGEK